MWSILNVIWWLVMIMYHVSRNGCFNLHNVMSSYSFCWMVIQWLHSNVQIIWRSHIWTLQPGILREELWLEFVIHLSTRNQNIQIRTDHTLKPKSLIPVWFISQTDYLMDLSLSNLFGDVKYTKEVCKKESTILPLKHTYSS